MSGTHAAGGFWTRYVFSRDHKVIGIQYILTAMAMGLVGGALAAWIRVQLAWPGSAGISPEQYPSLVTMHGTLMIFFVVSLALVSGLGNIIIPLQVGARDMAYPFLNMLSFWTVLPACPLMLASFFVPGGAAAAGWTAYPPLSALKGAIPGSGWGQSLWLLAMALFIASFTMGGLNFVATIFNLRARGLTMMRLPLACWTYLVSSILGLLSFPALTAAAIMLLLDRHAGTSFFVPSGVVIAGQVQAHQGGTPLLFQHLFWFLGHPEVYVLVLPALGIAFDVIAAFSRRPPHGYRITVWSLIVVAVLGMVVWGHHMFTSGMNPYLGKYFSVVTLLITLPFAAIGVNLVASLWRARLRWTPAMLWALGLISAVGTGGLGGVYLGNATADLHFHDSYFVVGHFHFMIGMVTLFGTFAGIFYWFPKLTGRLMNERLGRLHFWLTSLPMFALFFLMHLQGLRGMMRRYYEFSQDYVAPVLWLQPVLTVLAFVVFASQALFLINFFRSPFRGESAGPNPWNATTLEWTTPSPAPHGNWPDETPSAWRGPYEYSRNGNESDFELQSAPAAPGVLPSKR
ncbi:MAG: cbb3-type cytochrome c oxidase subunit I [Planctomycetes bacterium]|nr:cbb3-type cytochrome c oxidase subunit I [Planctomycetota bacterium]